MKVGIYHSKDFDGLACGAIMKLGHPDIHLIGYDYGEPTEPLFDAAKDAELVIMADVSLPMDKMMQLAESCKRFIWIDHHISAINDFNALEKVPASMEHTLDSSLSACELTWLTIYGSMEDMPYTIFLLGKYDTWRQEMEEGTTWEDTLAFQYGMRLNFSIQHVIDMIEAEGDEHEVIDIGRAILTYQDQQAKVMAKYAYEVFIGYKDHKDRTHAFKAIALNTQQNNSNSFNHCYNPDIHDLMLCVRYNGSQWVYSLYTTHDHIDCSAIAKSFGGGGHRKAAGFVSDQFIGFKKI